MAYTAQWVNRVDHPQHVEIDLNLVDGAINIRYGSFDIPKTPAQVDATFLATKATAAIADQVTKDTFKANVTAFITTNADLNIIQFNNTDIATLISRNGLSQTSAQIKNFVLDKSGDANRDILLAIARAIYG